jgi:hypothetical protein
MFSVDFLWRISSSDYNIIRTCDRSIRNKFRYVGLSVFFVIILCFVSSYYAFAELFNAYIIAIPFAVFFALMIFNIYLLLLTTLERNLVPHISSLQSRSISLVLRIGFILFIAIIISKPIEMIFFEDTVKADITNFKYQKIEDYKTQLTKLHKNEIDEINKDKNRFLNYGNGYIEEVKQLDAKLNLIQTSIDDQMSKIRTKINRANFFIQGVKLLSNNHRVCWFFTIIICFCFVLPIILKLYISESSPYYQRKAEIEKELISTEYTTFKNEYTLLFKSKMDLDVVYFDGNYTDPPFNTKHVKDETEYFNEEDFINYIYQNV